MKIKKLAIQGFKSFVDKVEMIFPDGIITVVGPNGCGKSNVVDAIRWVMGEQSAKHLRGKLMEDIIFNGSDERKPVGMAEVALTFDNSDGQAPAEYADFSEITVSRRLFRSGDSEYYINKLPCRLKDITELFMDTGVGTRAYSIVEQGKIGAIVTMKPEERRTLIEEAAGVTKYKSKKNAALRKVDATEQNLLRVRDVIREVKRQINSLERQAKKAEKYKAIREEVRELELSISAVRFREMEESLKKENETLRANIDKEAGLSATIAAKDKALEEGRLKSAEAEERLKGEQELAYKASNRIVEYEHRLAFNEKEIERLKEEETRYGKEVGELKERLKEVSEREEVLKGELAEITGIEEGEAKSLKEMEEVFEKLTADSGNMENKIEALRGDLVHIATMKSNLQNSIVHLKERVTDIERRLDKKGEEKSISLASLEGAEKRFGEFDGRLKTLHAERLSIDGSKSAEVERLKTLREEADRKEKETSKIQQELHILNSRLVSLKELKEKYEGAKAGVRSIMQRHSESPLTDGVVGIVADFIDVPKACEGAVGGLLDQRLQNIVVEKRAKGMEAIDYLKEKAAGRGTFISSETTGKRSGKKNAAENWKGAGEPLKMKVAARTGFEWLLDTLFDGVLLVKDLAEGTGVFDAGFEGAIVTVDGEVIDGWGGITGGRGEGDGFDLLKRAREIKELAKEARSMEAKHKEGIARKAKLVDEIAAAENALDSLKQSEFSKNMEISNLEKDKDLAEREVEREREKVSLVNLEEEQLKGDQGEFSREIESTGEKLAAYGGDEKKKGIDIKALQEEFAALRESTEKSRNELTEFRVENASLREKRENLDRELANIGETCQETLRRLDRDERLLLEGREKAKKATTEIVADKEALDEILKEHETLKTSLTEKKNAFEEVAAKIRSVESELKELHRTYETVGRETSNIKVAATEKEMSMRHLVEGMEERYGIDSAARAGGIPAPTERDEERLSELKGKIEAMGEVNLTALQEHTENLERLTFLEEQEKDLADAIVSLKRAISRINTTSRQRFKEAFDAINKKFEDLFPTLFRGGKARLVLTDEEDLLETGVEIVAQPPGKKLQNLNLLSGGEKALTAITLIFAIFLVKPSPFCLLDEVDAPLDDANVGRFNDLVKKMSQISQIIMITHNKSSIAIGDTLYGVTMEAPGVSKFVSVQLN